MQYTAGDNFNESFVAKTVNLQRLEQDFSQGLSLKTIAALGKNSAMPYYYASNESSAEITDKDLLLIDSGGQYSGRIQ